MAIETTWGNDRHSVIVYRLVDPWTWDEYFANTIRSNAMLDSVTHPVIAIYDFTASHRVPEGTVTYLRHIAQHRHPNTLYTIVVKSNALLNVMQAMIAARYPCVERDHLLFVDTMDDAFARIARLHPQAV